MRHHSKNRKFGRERNQRRALLRSLALSLVEHGRIVTTEAKAKELRPFIEKLITHGKEKKLPKERLIRTRLGGNEQGGQKIMNEIAPRFKERKGGYTRITKIPPGKSDRRKMAVIEFV
ncbi:MAG: 50S ribosomal protein L17 [Candidatus Lloydbacteria bacterium RIFCSPHIGHO2_02_FULL_51_22]|uniref:50S ribosomal protein L17 n=3 Tax=Candidatus Lloydiibacteriota TaxID=1817910 RepID=A0A1G2DH81_9BACT|nr:MAG: 50S ribosomal protein L17 [Candidatus Lloydbacteria bacterium RIFCSPHIGHO2_02_FULL_51_22]OGZ14659.1 MAG: 50S ribosomal protein L17 [Candidatus Lloydbacteria bacterium RIFCSPLOWO2_02_FULL_51_11]OGZ16864.1 MAG: 50S ribosomal protein L17 [Candidatus Lloydbacteria bacterium RIFCSPLOWO2_12_FULL_51_9]